MQADEVILEVLNILDMNLGFADTDKPRIRSAMESLLEEKITEEVINLLLDMGHQQEGYAMEGVENVECLETAQRYFDFVRKLRKIMAHQK